MKVKVGDIVVFNGLPTAAKYDVLAIDGFCMKVRESGTNYRVECSDTSLVYKIVKREKRNAKKD